MPEWAGNGLLPFEAPADHYIELRGCRPEEFASPFLEREAC